jgi:uncharacterized membrane protein
MAFCSGCGTAIADGTTTCAACSANAPAAAAASAATAGNDNLMGALSYFWIIGLIFLLIEPYNKNKFIRFHAFQSIFMAVAWFACWIILMVIPIVGWILIPIVFLAFIITLIVMAVKAYQGNMFRLPVIGDQAAKQAGV